MDILFYDENILVCIKPVGLDSEQELPQIFKLADRENRVYRCLYCEAAAKE